MATAVVPVTTASAVLPSTREGLLEPPPMAESLATSSIAALAAALAIWVAASAVFATSEAGSPASAPAAGASSFLPFGFFGVAGSVAAVPSAGAGAFGSVGSAAGACLAFLDAFNVVLDELVRVVVPLAFGWVLVAATMRARVSRLMIYL